MSAETQLCKHSWQVLGDNRSFMGWHDCARYEDHDGAHRCACGLESENDVGGSIP